MAKEIPDLTALAVAPESDDYIIIYDTSAEVTKKVAVSVYLSASVIQDQIDAKVGLTGVETIAGVKTFSSSPIVPAPTTDLQPATKKYVDDEINAVTSNIKTDDYEILSSDMNAQIILGSATAANKTFTLLNVGASNDGFIVWVLNDSDYEMTVKPYDSNESMQGTGDGYGWVATQKGCAGAWIYNHSDTTWYPITSMSGGLWIVEGLKIWAPLTYLTVYQENHAYTVTPNKSGKHYLENIGDIYINTNEASAYSTTFFFDGTNDYIRSPDSSDWDIGNSNTNDVVVFFRFYTDAADAVEDIMSQRENDADEWFIQKKADNALRFRFISSDGDDVDFSGGTVAATTWTNGCLVRLADEWGLYLGTTNTLTQVAFYDTAWAPSDFIADLKIGGGGDSYFDGRMNDIVIAYQNLFNAAPNSTPDDTITIPEKFNLAIGGE